MEIADMYLKISSTIDNTGANWTGQSQTFQMDPLKMFCHIVSPPLTVVTLNTQPYSFASFISLRNNILFYHTFYFQI